MNRWLLLIQTVFLGITASNPAAYAGRIIVTGATGHVGTMLLAQLCPEDHRVIAVHHDPDSRVAEISELYLNHCRNLPEFRRVDVTKDDLTRLFEPGDVVIHMAAMIKLTPDPRVAEVNELGTQRVLAACEAADIERFIFTSSIEAVEPTDRMIDDRHLDLRDHGGNFPAKNFYPYTKAAAHHAVKASPLTTQIFMLPGIIGRGAHDHSPINSLFRGDNRWLPGVAGDLFPYVPAQLVAQVLHRAATGDIDRVPPGMEMFIPGRMLRIGDFVAACDSLGRRIVLTWPGTDAGILLTAGRMLPFAWGIDWLASYTGLDLPVKAWSIETITSLDGFVAENFRTYYGEYFQSATTYDLGEHMAAHYRDQDAVHVMRSR